MGVQPIEPGFAKVRIKPQVGSLKTASLDLPTVRGTIHADFQSEPEQSFILNVVLPGNVEGVIYLPRLGSDDRRVLVDDRPVTGSPQGEFIVIHDVGAGKHRLERRLAQP